ncbi:hypothetical protein M0R45_014778 [Rubus argutus]|uniref:Legume lectin domain-containing protein n=1 Tax=Rubus argutus TaxID=59490 RepID=A0AAW1XN85_RUBAR
MRILNAGNFLLSLLTRTYIFLLLTPSSTPLHFEFPTFPNNTITLIMSILTTSSSDSPKAKTPSEGASVGRVTYHEPFHLWKKSTGELADFTSNFTFFIESANDSNYGDGLSFFIATNGSSLNRTLGRGSSLGLPVDSQGNVSRNQLAVEFDIFHDGGTAVDDPASDHVGIDINSVKSITTLPWNASVLEVKGNRVSVSYDSGTKVPRAYVLHDLR